MLEELVEKVRVVLGIGDNTTSELGWYDVTNFSINTLSTQILKGGIGGDPNAKVRVKVSGTCSFGYGFDKIHISKRFVLDDDKGQIAIIELTPFVSFQGSDYEREFEETLDINVPMWKWGENNTIIISGSKSSKIVLRQTK